ncbi:basic amino acid ABC transporter substrate-binding protein [Nostoc sp. XA010]|uniref:basic amino acid ABC transporter substrate-binding protein n=1 Tax=Nostoc sp. XA010 TaxID=2780407 RepID=UPI001E2E6FCD|nr:basic amino acid ABC transporter substrate-binding protein [Nostoc sp. XA010]MCC5661379.1 basic amino acid ABC transporter substrate-binding protein [Nostoc sp. XA010]
MARFVGVRWWNQFILAFICFLLIIACSNHGSNLTAKQTLKVAIQPTFAPFQFMKNGQLQGFDIDIVKGIGKSVGFQVEFENLRFEGMLGALQAGTVDAAVAAMSITKERLNTVSFSNPYFRSGLAITVRDNNQNITNFDSLRNKRIAVLLGTTGANEAKKVPGATIITLESTDQAFLDLINGNVDAVINDVPVILYALKTGSLRGIKIAGELLTQEYYGIPVRKNSPNLNLINKGLDTIIKDGTYAQIYKKWFNTKPPQLPKTAPV